MQSAREEEDEVKLRVGETSDVRAYLAEDPSPTAPRAASFEKNYPKNLFIPLIEHLAECGLQTQYEECVGTRASFEGKNVVLLLCGGNIDINVIGRVIDYGLVADGR